MGGRTELVIKDPILGPKMLQFPELRPIKTPSCEAGLVLILALTDRQTKTATVTQTERQIQTYTGRYT